MTGTILNDYLILIDPSQSDTGAFLSCTRECTSQKFLMLSGKQVVIY